jgi:hypothetical protein
MSNTPNLVNNANVVLAHPANHAHLALTLKVVNVTVKKSLVAATIVLVVLVSTTRPHLEIMLTLLFLLAMQKTVHLVAVTIVVVLHETEKVAMLLKVVMVKKCLNALAISVVVVHNTTGVVMPTTTLLHSALVVVLPVLMLRVKKASILPLVLVVEVPQLTAMSITKTKIHLLLLLIVSAVVLHVDVVLLALVHLMMISHPRPSCLLPTCPTCWTTLVLLEPSTISTLSPLAL